MRLVVDTSVLVGELLRTSGRARVGDDRLELFCPEPTWDEARIELPHLTTLCIEAVEANATIVTAAVVSAIEEEARARSLRNPNDWPVIACALALSADIWTNDDDFLGSGVATWTTESLRVWLTRHPSG